MSDTSKSLEMQVGILVDLARMLGEKTDEAKKSIASLEQLHRELRNANFN